MENVLAFLGLVGLIVIIWLWNKGTKTAGAKFQQTVLQPKAHQAGSQITNQMTIYLVNVPKSVVYEAVKGGIAAAPEQPIMPAQLYLQQASDSLIAYCYGRKGYQVGFQHNVTILATKDDHTSVSCRLANWAKVNGIVHHQKEMKQFTSDIEAILRRLDPKLGISVSNG